MNHDIFRVHLSLVLQGILELEEEAAVADDALAFLETVFDHGATVVAVSDLDLAARKLVGARLDVNEGLVFRVTQDGCVRHGERILDRAGLDRGIHVHVFFELVATVFGNDARL